MPLVSLSGPQAIAMRKASSVAHWGDRNLENRVEPITRPAFDVPFKLKPGEPIFTIGSCFARNIETELEASGFRIPMRDLFRTEAFQGLDAEIVNNFGTPSIYNEFAWAFGEEEFDYERGFCEVSPGKFVDLQMVPGVRPAPLKLVKARRGGLLRATREMARCRVVIMTLGLVELWWDEEAQLYLNSTPLPSVLRNAPERFSLHVLNFEECYGYLKSAFDVMFRHGREDMKVILTVSPVPMMATHRRIDVITANTYSKSLLRTVAEHLVENDDRITYFPSYETVTLSNRKVAWSDDMVHVTRPMVAFNVERLLAAFGDADEPAELELPDISADEGAPAILLAEQARRARAHDDEEFFEEHKAAAGSSPRFALEYARFLIEHKRFRPALDVLGNNETTEAQWLRADIHLALEEFDDVLRIAEEIIENGAKGVAHWRLMLDVHTARDDKAGVLAVDRSWAEADPQSASLRLVHVGRALRRIGGLDEAIGRLAEVADDPQLQPGSKLEYVRALIDQGRADTALEVLSTAVPETGTQEQQIKNLRNRIRLKRKAIDKESAGKAE